MRAGELYAPSGEVFVRGFARLHRRGQPRFRGLVDLTAERTSTPAHQIESPDLLAVDLDDQPVHLERMIRLVRDYDEVCERSGCPSPVPVGVRRSRSRFRPDPPRRNQERSHRPRRNRPGRFLDDLAKADGGGAPRASLKLVLLPPP